MASWKQILVAALAVGALFLKTRERLVGRVYSKSLLDSVTELAGKDGD